MNKPFAPATRAEPPPGGFTADEYFRMLELGAFGDMNVELVGGYLERMTPANFDHAEVHASVISKLAAAINKTGLKLAADLAVRIDALTVRGLDIAVVLPERTSKKPIEGGDVMLAVEVAGTTIGRDLGAKLSDYARAGIPTYWVVDVKAKIVQVLTEPTANEYARVDVVRFGEPLHLPGSKSSIVID